MTFRWKHDQVICLLVFNQLIDQHRCLPEENVLVHQAMAQHQRSLNISDLMQRACSLISFYILLWKSHVPFCVGCIVKCPVGNRGSRYSSVKYVRAFRETFQRHVPSIRPPRHSHPVRICPSLIDGVLHTSGLIRDFQLAHVSKNRRFETESPAIRATVVHLNHRESLVAQELSAQVGRHHSPGVLDVLNVRTSVGGHDEGVRSGSVD
mmetsp:Transcript_13810/g.26337  ORF Transcript_13810/g.26337 Transcript_13810/m.26337 type:complete len:208 (-) Transcript_13810:434-1057(-)